MAKLLDSGLTDLYRQVHPDGRMFSWWDYRGGGFHRNLGLRIDLLLASPAVVSKVEDVWTDRDFRKKREGQTPSDHAPVIADLAD
jgi:exodeoxyribonuclease-3